MYTVTNVPIMPGVGATPASLPIRVLLALPTYTTVDADPGTWRFNLPAALVWVLGSYGWERASKIMDIRIWAPGWNDDRLRTFVTSLFLDRHWDVPGFDPAQLREPAFPGTLEFANLEVPITPLYDIVHFVGEVRRGEPILDLGITPNQADVGLTPGSLRDTLVATRSRLLILDSRDILNPERLAGFIVGAGGPAVLVVTSWNPQVLTRYLLQLYSNIIHSFTLSDAARPTPEMEANGLTATLVLGNGGESLLQLEPYVTRLTEQVAKLRQLANRHNEVLVELRTEMTRHLHRSQLDVLDVGVAREMFSAQRLLSRLDATTSQLPQLHFELHEKEGVVPLSQTQETIAALDAEIQELARRQHELNNRFEREASVAPRVLNASVSDVSDHRILEPQEPLIEQHGYDILVDIGPRWTAVSNIVIGSADFPEATLPAEKDGYIVRVVLVSEDFSPHIATHYMWVPRGTGQSFPFINGQAAPEPGPIAFRVLTPEANASTETARIGRARLCLYYGQTMLQSAILKTSIVRANETGVTQSNSLDSTSAITRRVAEYGGELEPDFAGAVRTAAAQRSEYARGLGRAR